MSDVVVNDNDVLAIATYEVTLKAAKKASRDEEPTFIDARTYRRLDYGMYYLSKYV